MKPVQTETSTSTPKVTVVVPTYNPGDYLRAALDSVLAQTTPDWRLVVIDDGSTDHSLSTVSRQLEDPRVQLVRNETNLGQAASLNRGLEYTETEFFLQLDADDWLAPNAIERFLSEAERGGSRVGLIVSSVIVFNEDTGVERPVRQAKWGKEYENRYQMLLANLFPWQKFYRASALRHVGGWSEDPDAHVEDLAMFLKLIDNFEFTWIDELLYYYRVHSRNITSDRAKIASGVEWLIRGALTRWESDYEPIFVDTDDGWRILGGLISR